MKPAVVKLFTRPVVKGQRKFVPVNPKKDYPPRGTTFILRWLPKGTSTYRTHTLAHAVAGMFHTLQSAQIACASFVPPTHDSLAEKTAAPLNLEEWRTAFLIDKKTTRKKDGTSLDPDTMHSYDIVTREFLDTIKRTKPENITQRVRDKVNEIFA